MQNVAILHFYQWIQKPTNIPSWEDVLNGYKLLFPNILKYEDEHL